MVRLAPMVPTDASHTPTPTARGAARRRMGETLAYPQSNERLPYESGGADSRVSGGGSSGSRKAARTLAHILWTRWPGSSHAIPPWCARALHYKHLGGVMRPPAGRPSGRSTRIDAARKVRGRSGRLRSDRPGVKGHGSRAGRRRRREQHVPRPTHDLTLYAGSIRSSNRRPHRSATHHAGD
jgi:hypothetical protein